MNSGDPVVIGLAVVVLGVLGAALGLAAKLIEFMTARRRAAEAAPVAEPLRSQRTDPALDPLPSPSPGFVNRTRELDTAEQGVYGGGEALVIFEGDKGIGKSEAAIQLAHRLRDGEPRGGRDLRDHEFVWVMSRTDRGGVTLADIGRALSVETADQSVSAVSDASKLHRLRRHLATHKTALVLDGIRLGDDGERDGMHEFLRVIPDGSLVIAAADSRGVDLDGFHVELKPLKLEDVEGLVAKLARRLDLPTEQFDRAFARRLHEVVGGDPRTVTWFLRSCKGSAEGPDRRLETLRSGVGLDRLFEPIWQGLDPDARVVLSTCACLGGKATARQLAAGCGAAERSVLRTAEGLYRDGVLGVALSAGQQAFLCSQALGLYVTGATPSAERYGCLRRIATHYVSVLRTEPENARALLPEVDALRAVFDGLQRQAADGVEDLRVHTALQELFKASLDVLLTLGLFDDRIVAARYAYESSMQTGNHRGASLACEVLASTHALRGEFEPAELALRHGQVAAEASGDEAEIARQSYSEAFLRYREARPWEALESIDGAEDRAVAGDDLETLINVLDVRAAVHLYLGETEACNGAAQRCLAVCEKIGWERAKSFPLRFLAEVAIHRADSDSALELLDRARALASGYDDQRQLARISVTAARMRLLDRDLDLAAEEAASAVSESGRLGLPPEEEEALALADAISLARRAPATLDDLASRRPTRLTEAPVGGD